MDYFHKNKILLERVKFINATDWLSEVLLMIMYGDFVSFYLSVLNKVSAGANDAIDKLKEKMA
jgi:hypothetical protein